MHVITKTNLPNIFQSVFIHIVYTAIFPFNPLTPNNNSPYCLPYQSYDASWKNLLLDQIIP